MRLPAIFALVLTIFMFGCGKSDKGSKKFISIGSAPGGGTFFVIGGAFESVINANEPSLVTTNESTKGSRENIVRLKKKEINFAQ